VVVVVGLNWSATSLISNGVADTVAHQALVMTGANHGGAGDSGEHAGGDQDDEQLSTSAR
jgi:hypothetical protein